LLEDGFMNRFWLNELSKDENDEFIKNGNDGEVDRKGVMP